VLYGALALVLRFFGPIPQAAVSFLIGALITRIGRIAVGKVSAADPEAVFASQGSYRALSSRLLASRQNQ
jgi:hypothetical protein